MADSTPIDYEDLIDQSIRKFLKEAAGPTQGHVPPEADSDGWHFPATPIQAAAYVSTVCRTGELGFQTLIAAYLRLRMLELARGLQLQINRSSNGGVQPDFQLMKEDGTGFAAVFAAEFKLIDSEGYSGGSPENQLVSLKRDLNKLATNFSNTPGMAYAMVITNEQKNHPGINPRELASLQAIQVGDQITLWRPKGIKEGPYQLRVFKIRPQKVRTEQPQG